MIFNGDQGLRNYFNEKVKPSRQMEYQRRALSRSAGHGCVHTRPVEAVALELEGTLPAGVAKVHYLFDQLIGGLIERQFVNVVRSMWKVEILTPSEEYRTSLGMRAFRKWLSQEGLLTQEVSLLVADGLAALARAETDEEFRALIADLGWSPDQLEKFNELERNFVCAKSADCAAYFSSIMEQQKHHSARRFEQFISIHRSFVNNVIGHIPELFAPRFKNTVGTALAHYKQKHVEIYSPRVGTNPKTEKEKSDEFLKMLYRGRPMVKHAPDQDVNYQHPYGIGREICVRAQNSFFRALAPLDFCLDKKVFEVKGLRYHFVSLQEAHVSPATKIFSAFSVHFAENLGMRREEASEFKDRIITEITHKVLFGDEWESRLKKRIDDIKRIASPKERCAKLFILFEMIALLEGSQTNHMPAYYNQKIDHLSESLAKVLDPNGAFECLALRIAMGLHRLLESRKPITPEDVLRQHAEYVMSVKVASRDWIRKRGQKMEDPIPLLVKRALKLVGAFDHLMAVYSVEKKYLKSVEIPEGLPHEMLLDLMDQWVRGVAAKNNIVLKDL